MKEIDLKQKKNQLLNDLGLKQEEIGVYADSIADLEKTTPGMVIGEAIQSFVFSINHHKLQRVNAGDKKIMSLFMFERLQADKAGKISMVPAPEKFRDEYRPYKGQDLSNKSLLVWRTGGIGDLLFIQPNLRWLKRRYPTCKIIFGCSPQYISLINNWKCLDQIVYLPIDFKIFKETDYHLTFEGVIERCHEAKRVNAYRIFSRWMGLNLNDEFLKPLQFTKNKNNKYVIDTLKKFDVYPYNYICCQVRTSSPVRTPPLITWKNIFLPLVKEGYKLVITDRPGVNDQIDNLINLIFSADLKKNVVNFCNYSKEIDITISLAKNSKLVIAPDSSLVHIAASVGTPVFGIYGPFPGELRMETYDKADWIEPDNNKNICQYNGKHCFIHGHKPCPNHDHGASPCFININYELALKKIHQLLELKRS